MPADLHSTSRPRSRPDLSEGPTQGLAPGAPFVLDSLSLLDHRTRARALVPESAPAGRYLAVAGADGRALLVALQRPITRIGRGLGADVRFEDPRVSRGHAILAAGAGGMRVLDDRSSTGTFVNGRRVMAAELHDGDVIRFGPVAVRYLEVAAPRTRRVRPLRRIPLARVVRRRLPAAA